MSAGAATHAAAPPVDVREALLRGVRVDVATASVVAVEAGVAAGTLRAAEEARSLGLSIAHLAAEGEEVPAGAELMRFSGAPRQVVTAEDALVGILAKPSGIATRARAFATAARGRLQVVAGGWRKMPPALKDVVRGAIVAGGCEPRMVPGPFVYLDKTWLALLGGIAPALAAVSDLALCKVVQVKGRTGPIADEACAAASLGANVVFVDSGRLEHAAAVAEALRCAGLRGRMRLAFGGGVTLDDLDLLARAGVELVDVGRPIVDAPLLDLRLEILEPRVRHA